VGGKRGEEESNPHYNEMLAKKKAYLSVALCSMGSEGSMAALEGGRERKG